jgi:GT2 family glycosyltransferase
VLEATLVLVNFRSEGHVAEALAQLESRPEDRPAQIVVIDNSPERGLEDRLAYGPARVEYLGLPRNAGFAAAVNLGLERARCASIVLLNPDARPEAGCLRGLVDALASSGAAVAGPSLVPFDDAATRVPSATRIDPTWWTTMVEHTVARRLAPPGWLDLHYFLRADGGSEALDCATVQGACLALSAEWLGRVGRFDQERFFLYWEETDFCRRVRAAGGRVVYCPWLRCRHLGGASTPNGRQDTRAYWRSFYAYHRKYAGRGYAALLGVSLLGGVAAEYLLLSALNAWRRGRDPVLLRDRAAMGARVVEQMAAWRK